MKIVKIEDLHCDAGWRVNSFVKITTDEGIVGWSEYMEGYGAPGLTGVIRKIGERLIGRDPRPVEAISALLYAAEGPTSLRVQGGPVFFELARARAESTGASGELGVERKLYRLRRSNLGFRIYPRALIEENKWRAARWGIDGKLIDFGQRKEVAMRDLAHELCAFVDDVVDELGSRREIEYVNTIVREGTSADRQLQVYRESGDLKAVMQWIVDEKCADGISGVKSPLHSESYRLSPMRGVIRRVEEQRFRVRRNLDANAMRQNRRAGRAGNPFRSRYG